MNYRPFCFCECWVLGKSTLLLKGPLFEIFPLNKWNNQSSRVQPKYDQHLFTPKKTLSTTSSGLSTTTGLPPLSSITTPSLTPSVAAGMWNSKVVRKVSAVQLLKSGSNQLNLFLKKCKLFKSWTQTWNMFVRTQFFQICRNLATESCFTFCTLEIA